MLDILWGQILYFHVVLYDIICGIIPFSLIYTKNMTTLTHIL